MATKRKANGAIPVTPSKLIDLDDGDREFVRPRIQQVLDGRRAQAELQQYLGSIARRSGFSGTPKVVIDRACTKIVVTPETKH
jgi:hypothetical protein